MHCNCYSQKRQIMNIFEQYLQLRIKFLCFAHIPIPTCRFWRGTSVNIIWIWSTAIVIAINDQKWCFLGILSVWRKFLCFAHIQIPKCIFWSGMSVKIIWLWHTAIDYSKDDQNGVFKSTLIKIYIFCAYNHPIMVIFKTYEF